VALIVEGQTDKIAIRRSKFKSMPLLFREMLCCSPVSSKKDLAG